MPVATTVQRDVRLVVQTGADLLLVAWRGEEWHELPGGPVAAGESVEAALARHAAALTGLAGVGGPTVLAPAAWRFCGGAEYAGTAPGGATSGAPGLTLLFGARWPEGVPLPVTWEGAALVAVPVEDLLGTRLRPVPVGGATRQWLEDAWPQWRGLPIGGAAGADPRWSGLRRSVRTLRAQLAARRGDMRHADFRDAGVAMCALVAAADGRIDPAERDRMRAFVATDEVLSAFPPEELERVFDEHVDRLRADFATGKAAALRAVAEVRGRPAEARAVVMIGAVIGRADGVFDEQERAVVREAIDVLGLDPADFAVQAVANEANEATP